MVARFSLLLAFGFALTLGLWVLPAGGEGSAPPDRFVSAGHRLDAPNPPDSDSYCLTCHSNPSLSAPLGDGQSLSLQVDARGLKDSAHAFLSCVTCHEARTSCPRDGSALSSPQAYRVAATVMCYRCHIATAGEYEGSVHSEDLLTKGEGAACYECHSPDNSAHTIAWLDGRRSGLTLEPVNQTCGRCHQAELSSYLETSHGRMAQFGDAASAASCATCHGDHRVTAVDDPSGPLTAVSLAPVCAQCHRGADAEFAEAWPGHADPSPSRLPGIYYMERSILFLTAATLGFGFVHVSLDLLRRLAARAKR